MIGRRWGEPIHVQQTEALTALLSKLNVKGGNGGELEVVENLKEGGMENVVRPESTGHEFSNGIESRSLTTVTMSASVETLDILKEKVGERVMIRSKENKEEEREARVLKEIPINEHGGNSGLLQELKENVDPGNNVKDIRTWKRLARSYGAIPTKGEALIGRRPSLTWRSLFAGKSLIMPDLFRCVGNGRTTRIWDDAWVLGAPPFTVPRPQNGAEGVENVSDLINASARGLFTVNACYKHYMAEQWRDVILLPDLQGFRFWAQSRFDFSSSRWHGSLVEWLDIEGVNWSKEQWGYCSIALYLLWEMRNGKKFASKAANLDKLWCNVTLLWEEITEARSGSKGRRQDEGLGRWVKPPRDVVKLNSDAGLLPSGGGIVGGVLRDNEGHCLGAITEGYGHSSNPMVLEAVAMRSGLELALSLGIEEIIIESDTKLVLEFLDSIGTQISPLLLVFSYAKDSNHDSRWVEFLPWFLSDVIRSDI
ncbi:reverse transcriptase [Senna tora]|uniref:Reverse transcriptase n=1 Tax=Senna tora TaxID=362788 RepID=A0A834XAA0_9FABA|nr:reverse transcriptase [Senna tora]